MAPGTTEEKSRQMMQTLLQDRFKLQKPTGEKRKICRFSRFVIGKGGFKLQPSDPAKDVPRAPHSIGCPPEDPGCHFIGGGSSPISVLASMLSRNVGRPVD